MKPDPDPDPVRSMAVILLIPACMAMLPVRSLYNAYAVLGVRGTRLLVATSHFAENATHIINNRSNRRFPEITSEDNLTVFSYSGRVKSPEWRRQRRRSDLRHIEIFRHGPIIIYTRLEPTIRSARSPRAVSV